MVLYKDLGGTEATTNYGIFAQKAMTISNIPIALASAMSSAIVPTIATTYAQGAWKQTVKKVASSIKVTMLISIAATVIFYGLSTLTNAVLQGIGKVNTPVINATIALIIQTAVLVPIIWYTDLGIYGVMIATVVYSLLMCILNGISIRKYLGYKQEMDKTFARPLFSAVIMGAAAFGVYEGISYFLESFMTSLYTINLIALAAAVFIAIIIYFILIIKLKAVKKSELKGLPKGRTLIRIAAKLKLL